MNLLLLNLHVGLMHTHLILNNKAVIPSIAFTRKFVDHSKEVNANKMLARFIYRFREVIGAYKRGLEMIYNDLQETIKCGAISGLCL